MSTPEQSDNNESLSLGEGRELNTTSLEIEILRIVNTIDLKQAGSLLPEISTEIPAAHFPMLAHMLPHSLEIRSPRSVDERVGGVPSAVLKVLWDDGTRREVYVESLPGDLKLVVFDAALRMEYKRYEGL